MSTYDVLVLGTGGVGSAALYHLARRGVRVAGIDRFPPTHDRGSSHGQTRMIRQAYFEHPDYVPLVERAYALWEELSQQCGQALYQETGLLEVGPPQGLIVPGVLSSARRHGLQVESFSPADVAARWPGFRVPEACAAVFEKRAGYLRVEACVQAHLDAAVSSGAVLHTGEAVRAWRAVHDGVAVDTERATFTSQRLVIAAGAWAGELLADLGIRFQVRRKPQYWFHAAGSEYLASRGCPAFLFETVQGLFYGFPQIDPLGVKMAEHSGGANVESPLRLEREIDPLDLARVEAFAARCLPRVSRRLTRHAPCMYTMTPDEHFVVDRHPRHPQVAFAAGLSGHGFKFACVLGQALADLALDGCTPLPIGFLGAGRAGLQHEPRA